MILCAVSLFMLTTLASCGSDDEDTDTANYKAQQAAYFENIYDKAKDNITLANNDGVECKDWYIFPVYYRTAASTNKHDYIVVQVLNEKKHSENPDSAYAAIPYYNDYARAFYRGYCGPTSSTKQTLWDGTEVGKQFDTNFNDASKTIMDLNTEPATIALFKPTDFTMSGSINGFATALMHMHVGDKWRVYIPQELGYGSTEKTNIKPYSTLIFDVYLTAFSRNSDDSMPAL